VCLLLSEGMTQAEIVKEVGLSQSKVSRIKHKLEKGGFIKKGVLTENGKIFVEPDEPE